MGNCVTVHWSKILPTKGGKYRVFGHPELGVCVGEREDGLLEPLEEDTVIVLSKFGKHAKAFASDLQFSKWPNMELINQT